MDCWWFITLFMRDTLIVCYSINQGNTNNKVQLIRCLKMKRLSEYIHFAHSHHETQDKCILRGVLWQKSVTPPPDPQKYPTVWHWKQGGEWKIESYQFFIWPILLNSPFPSLPPSLLFLFLVPPFLSHFPCLLFQLFLGVEIWVVCYKQFNQELFLPASSYINIISLFITFSTILHSQLNYHA